MHAPFNKQDGLATENLALRNTVKNYQGLVPSCLSLFGLLACIRYVAQEHWSHKIDQQMPVILFMCFSANGGLCSGPFFAFSISHSRKKRN